VVEVILGLINAIEVLIVSELHDLTAGKLPIVFCRAFKNSMIWGLLIEPLNRRK
jgi:hypothetical protein